MKELDHPLPTFPPSVPTYRVLQIILRNSNIHRRARNSVCGSLSDVERLAVRRVPVVKVENREKSRHLAITCNHAIDGKLE